MVNMSTISLGGCVLKEDHYTKQQKRWERRWGPEQTRLSVGFNYSRPALTSPEAVPSLDQGDESRAYGPRRVAPEFLRRALSI
jgi:hypothetical protein